MLGIYLYDRHYEYSTLTRNLRAISTFAVIAVDSQVQRLLGEYGNEMQLQERNAERFTKMFQANGGIYQKFGQSIALQSTIMPSEVRAKFEIFYDECPPVSLDEIAKVLQVDFDLPGTAASPEGVFDSLFFPGSFENKPVGVASIAQVHKARLKDTGKAVAVKIQKPAIQQQLSWDLWVLAYVAEDSPSFAIYIVERTESLICMKDHDVSLRQKHPRIVPHNPDRLFYGSNNVGDGFRERGFKCRTFAGMYTTRAEIAGRCPRPQDISCALHKACNGGRVDRWLFDLRN